MIEIKSVLGAVLYSSATQTVLSACLIEAVGKGADLTGADLTGADLTGANLRGADLTDANLKNVKCLHYTILPEGDIIGYKKLKGGTIAKLLIPAKAKRVNFIGSRKCRAEYVKVLDGNGESLGCNKDGQILQYKKGEITRCVHKFNDDPRLECESGVHFFITKIEAEQFNA
jgi:uncharacterized protein YjbI with pentapeptide repeats